MAERQLFKATYKRTNISNTKLGDSGAAGQQSFALSSFVGSGDVSVIPVEFKAVRFKHYHTASKSSSANRNGIQIRSFVTDNNGHKAYSPYQTWNTFNTSGPIAKTDSIEGLDGLNTKIVSVGIDWKAFNTSSSLYYRAVSGAPMELEIEFYDTVERKNIAKYYNGSKWVDCEPYYYNGSAWILVEMKYYDGSKWVDCSH